MPSPSPEVGRPALVTVVAGGWSASRFLDRVEGVVIAVNDAAFHVAAQHVVSMDRLWLEHRWADLEGRGLVLHGRSSALRNVPERPWIRPFLCDHQSAKPAESPATLNGTHSGLCALNLAYQRRPKRLRLIGFDMRSGPDGQAHFYPDYPWAKPGGATSGGKFKAWADQFGPLAIACRRAGIEVDVLGDSAIAAFKERR